MNLDCFLDIKSGWNWLRVRDRPLQRIVDVDAQVRSVPIEFDAVATASREPQAVPAGEGDLVKAAVARDTQIAVERAHSKHVQRFFEPCAAQHGERSATAARIG